MTCKKECMEQKKDGTLKDCELAKENAELKAQIEKLEAESSSKDECIDNLEYQLKDAAGELELWQRENAELKKQIEKMKCCSNCKYCGACNRACNNWDKWEIYD